MLESIFHAIAEEGLGGQSIAKRLNDKGITSKTGNAWQASTTITERPLTTSTLPGLLIDTPAACRILTDADGTEYVYGNAVKRDYSIMDYGLFFVPLQAFPILSDK